MPYGQWTNRRPGPFTGLGPIALSPNGSTVATLYKGSLVLYDWRRETVTRLPDWLAEPTFSPDGRWIAGRDGDGQISSLELDTGRLVAFTKEAKPAFAPICPRVSPDGRKIAVATASASNDSSISLVDCEKREVRRLIPAKFGFYSVSDLCFVGRGEILFQAAAPRDPMLAQQVKAIRDGFVSENYQYRLIFDPEASTNHGDVSVLTPQLDTRPSLAHQIQGLCASRSGAVLAWLGQSPGPKYGYEVFDRQGGVTRQATSRTSYTYACAISDDGNTIAFTEDQSRGLSFDLSILDRRSGAVIETRLLAKLDGG